MNLDIFNKTKHWTFTEVDQQAEEKFNQLHQTIRQSVPPQIYHNPLHHLDFMQTSPLYPLLRTLPKAVLHHAHFACCEDQDFVPINLPSIDSMWSQTLEFICQVTANS